MSTAEIQRCRIRPYWTSRQHQAIQYDGTNIELIAQLTKGQVSVIQATPPAADNSAPAKDLLLLSDRHTSFLQQIEVGDYIIWTQPQPEDEADKGLEDWRDVLSRSQYEKQWEPPTNPAELHTCLNKSREAAPDADERICLSLLYTGDNKAEVAEFLGGRIATVQIYDPFLKQDGELTLLTAYQDLEYLKPGDHLVIPINPQTNETMPERVRVLSDQDYHDEYEPVPETAG